MTCCCIAASVRWERGIEFLLLEIRNWKLEIGNLIRKFPISNFQFRISNKHAISSMSNWNERYQKGENIDAAPHPLVTRFGAILPPGRALDLACGPGRHALWLAEHGWDVTA